MTENFSVNQLWHWLLYTFYSYRLYSIHFKWNQNEYKRAIPSGFQSSRIVKLFVHLRKFENSVPRENLPNQFLCYIKLKVVFLLEELKMEPMVMNRKVLTWLCMYPFEEGTTWAMKMAYIIYTLVTFVVNFSAVFCAGAFIYKFVSTDLERCLYALLHIVAHSAIVYIQIAASYLQQKIKTDIFDHLKQIYEASK